VRAAGEIRVHQTNNWSRPRLPRSSAPFLATAALSRTLDFHLVRSAD